MPSWTRSDETRSISSEASSTADFQKGVTMKFTIIVLSIIFITDVGTCLEIDQSICTPGSDIAFHSNGQLKTCTLKDNFAINGVNCKQYAPIDLYESGKLKSCVTSDSFSYGKITCNQYSHVSFYATGKLHTCTLSKQIQIDGKTCAELGSISLFENGKLISCSKPN